MQTPYADGSHLSVKSLLDVPDYSPIGLIRRRIVLNALSNSERLGSVSKTPIETLPVLPEVLYNSNSFNPVYYPDKQFSIRRLKVYLLTLTTVSGLVFGAFEKLVNESIYGNNLLFFPKLNFIYTPIWAALVFFLFSTGTFIRLMSGKKHRTLTLALAIIVLFNNLVFGIIALLLLFFFTLNDINGKSSRIDSFTFNKKTPISTIDRDLLDLKEHPLTLASFISESAGVGQGNVSIEDAISSVFGHDLLIIGCDIRDVSQIFSLGSSSVSAYSAVVARAQGVGSSEHYIYTSASPWPVTIESLSLRFDELILWSTSYIDSNSLRNVLLNVASDLSWGSSGSDRASRVSKFITDKLDNMYR